MACMKVHRVAGLLPFQVDPLGRVRWRAKNSPQVPTPPNPQQVAQAQTGTNVSTAIANAELNNTNQVTPYGSTTYTQSGGYTDPTTGQFVPQFTENTQLNPLAQSLLTGTELIGNNMLPTAWNLSNEAASAATQPLNFNSVDNSIVQGGPQAINQRATQAAYGAQAGFLDPQWQQQQQNLQDQLSRQGIPVGSDAYNNAMTQFYNSRSQAYNAAAGTAVGQGEQAATNMFGLALQGQGQNVAQQELAQTQPLNLLSMIYGGGSVPQTRTA